jgi:hypothetical protein
MNMKRKIKTAIVIASLFTLGATDVSPGMDPDNPTCPETPNWSTNKTMELTPKMMEGTKVLLAEGAVDAGLPDRLRMMLADNPDISEVWLRSSGGNARAGNEAGRVIREADALIITRIPQGWTCFSACNFVFMGGRARIVEPGAHFMVHMFTMTNDRNAINYSIEMGTDSTVGLIGEVEQASALLATEDNDFLIRMGVSRKLLSEVMYKTNAVKAEVGDKSTRRCLTNDEALRYNVANVGG